VDYRNLKLINQFINEYNGEIHSTRKTGVCQTQYKSLLIAIEKARNLGLLEVDMPFVEYDYDKYMPKMQHQ
jgi:ribosomal protein S18